MTQMDVGTGIEPLLGVIEFFGLSTFDRNLISKRKIRCRSFLIFLINGGVQFRDWYELSVMELRGDITVWIQRYPHDSPVITFNCFFTTLLLLLYDNLICNQLSKLRSFNRKRFAINESDLNRLHRMTKALIYSCVTFCVVFITGNGFWWWYMHRISSLPRYVLYCLGLFAHFTACGIISSQIIIYYLLIWVWYRSINDHVAELAGIKGKKRVKRKITILMEADNLIKDFNERVNRVYSPFVLISCAVVLIESIHGAVYLVVTPDVKKYEVIATLFFVATLVTQITFFIAASTFATDEAEKTPCFTDEINLNELWDGELRQEVEIFSLQLLHRNIQFSACGFYKLDFSLLYGMAGTVTTYIVILVQYESSNGVKIALRQ